MIQNLLLNFFWMRWATSLCVNAHNGQHEANAVQHSQTSQRRDDSVDRVEKDSSPHEVASVVDGPDRFLDVARLQVADRVHKHEVLHHCAIGIDRAQVRGCNESTADTNNARVLSGEKSADTSSCIENVTMM